MKLKLVKPPHGQKDMVVNTNHGTYAVDVGQTIDVKDEAGHEILGKWGRCFEMVASAPAPEVKKKVEPKPEPASEELSAEKAAEIEATKVVKSYSNKKV